MKISVIMPSFNQARFVEAAICSVLEQDYPDKELIFCDGGSTDGTVEIASRYAARMSYFASMPDRGQSDALRNGFARATGDFLTWLNTDDLLLPGALSEVAALALRRPGTEWIAGNLVWIDANGQLLKLWKAGNQLDNLATRFGMFSAGGPTSFFSRTLYERSGGLDETLHYMMDTELWWRFITGRARFARVGWLHVGPSPTRRCQDVRPLVC